MFGTFRARRAGRRAGKDWLLILNTTQEEIEVLAGLTLYGQARDQARKWVISQHPWFYILSVIPANEEPEVHYHGEFLAFVSGFISQYTPERLGPPRSAAYLKQFEG